jgi:pyruvate kinase
VITDAVEAAQGHGYVNEGDIIIITGGSVGHGVGTTNLMKVHLIERILAHGTGLGERRVIGKVHRLMPPFDSSVRIEPDEIVVTPFIDRSIIPYLRRAIGLVTASTEQDSRCRLLAMEMGIPAVIGAREGIELLTDGMRVVLDAKRGVVYERPQTLVRMEES